MSGASPRPESFYRRKGKRLLDLALAIPAALLAAPLVLLLAGIVAVRMGRPALYRQLRPGLGGVPFQLLKLRTMTERESTADEPLPDEARLTALGRFLRRWSLDELPELWNVLRGEMSLVGPRPLLMEYLSLYDGQQMRRHDVRPGLTGWAQVHGRNDTTWRRRLEMDVWYTENLTLALDLRVLASTVTTVLSGDGVSANDHATMPRFDEGRDAD